MSIVDWDELAKNKSFQSVIDPVDTIGIKNSLIDQIQWNAISKSLEKNGSILDFGCGMGRFARRLVDKGLAYKGVDTSIGMIESAKQLNELKKAEFIYSGRLPLPFSDEHFDVCLSVGVLQYLLLQRSDEGVDVFAELARVLSPRGRLLIIEQASASGSSSGTVASGSSEGDYIDALSEFFIVEQIERIRCGRLTKLSSRYFRYGKFLPFRNASIKFLAKLETQRALKANFNYLKGMDYYDICIKAVKK